MKQSLSLIRQGWLTSESEQSVCLAISIAGINVPLDPLYYTHSGVTVRLSWASRYRLSFLLRSHMDTSLRVLTLLLPGIWGHIRDNIDCHSVEGKANSVGGL